MYFLLLLVLISITLRLEQLPPQAYARRFGAAAAAAAAVLVEDVGRLASEQYNNYYCEEVVSWNAVS